MITWLKLVPHHRRAEFEAIGWVFSSDLGSTHGFWSCLMRWAGEGGPVMPGATTGGAA